MRRVTLRQIGYLILVLKALMVTFILLRLTVWSHETVSLSFDTEFLWFMLAGFIAQFIDGSLGMAYGVSCSTMLMYMGIPPALITASVHTAEVFTTGVSGLSHLWFRNVNRLLLLRIVVPGVVGAVLGAYFISRVFDGHMIKPFIAAYLMLIGAVLIWKSFRWARKSGRVRRVDLLAFAGGLFDSIGGGGWGPFVTSNLIIQGRTPKMVIGTVNVAEFFITFCSTGVFIVLVGLQSWKIILALIAGGVAAAPIGAWAAGRIKPRILMRLVGASVIIASGYTIWRILSP